MKTGFTTLEIQVSGGRLIGTVSEGLGSFLGIPYAVPPVGALRWKPPVAGVSWDSSRSATSFGNPCTQYLDTIPVITERQRAPNEDCLYLNVWTPAPGDSAKLPVMVWFHGGAFVVGSGSAAEFDGANLAKYGVVVVTVNYRLGPFGFLSHPELAEESPHGSSGNYGLLDQLCALQWVRENIAAFGGDPGCVTLFGESAGGISISCHLASPLSRELFSHTIMQSGTWFTIPHGLPQASTDPGCAAANASKFAASLGCTTPGKVINELRQHSDVDLLAANKGKMLFCPVVDGWFLPEDPGLIFAAVKGAPVPSILGYNGDEGTRFTHTAPGSPEAEELAFRIAVEPTRRMAALMTAPTYCYRFSRVPKTDLASRFGAYHGVEVPYIFGNLDARLGYEEEDFALSDCMMRYWTTFARSGCPDPIGTTTWPPYNKDGENILNLGDR
ncbi:carboxylesterase family protein [Synechocystis sp. FACHB-383]|uniref:carboxylesterase/lipase family protein n=1 Tax=Synechocystis sp. FACHB-383 TaxID=2692864 RepID=UPI0016890C0C|nr:carboxylesterase family protein [Synechocystis sp. FACHB-383]MBD2654741.1 carboxylesterase family protein [Synechocystis sp. FACHB-383]